jgi:hypothetical protein
MLNPSTADATTDDPTIRRCIGFARREGMGRLVVVNLFAYRATKPENLRRVTRDVARGPLNVQHVDDAISEVGLYGGILIAAWGAAPPRPRINVERLARTHRVPIVCLGHTSGGDPRHPLYVRGDAPLVPFQD